MKSEIITMKTLLVISAATLLVGTAAVQAQNMTSTQDNNPLNGSSWFSSDPGDLYRANELSVDAFAAGASDGRRHDHYYDFGYHHRQDVRGGGGGGLEYFFCRYIGIEAESFALAGDHNTASALGGNLVLRWPIAQIGISPYVFGGGGNEWTYRAEGYGEGGAGLEYRFNRSIGIFGDGRFVSPGSTRDYGMGRLGVRFAF
jgi:hypothetical protein